MAKLGTKTKGIAFIVDWIKEREGENPTPKGVDWADLERALCRERWGMSCNRCPRSTKTIESALAGKFIRRGEDGRLFLFLHNKGETEKKKERGDLPEVDAWGRIFQYGPKISLARRQLLGALYDREEMENPPTGPVWIAAQNAVSKHESRLNYPGWDRRAKLRRFVPILKGIFCGYLFIDIEQEDLPDPMEYAQNKPDGSKTNHVQNIEFALKGVILYLEDPKKYEDDGEHDAEFLRRQNRIRVRMWAAMWLMNIAPLVDKNELERCKILDHYCYMSDPDMAIEADLKQCKVAVFEDEIRVQEEWVAKGFKSRVDYLLAKNKEQDERLNKEQQDEEHDEGEDIF